MDFSKIKELKPYDLNCNIFDVYSYDGLSIQELLCQFFTKINECIKTSNETIDLAEWLVNEGLKQEVALKLTSWLNDGTLENLINVTLFENLNNKIDNVNNKVDNEIYNVNNKVDNVSSQLEQRAINVMSFGAIGDGVADDTEAIKNAITYAQSHPSKTIFLPKTKNGYLITSTINFYRMNVDCQGEIIVGFNGIGVIAGSSSSLGGENYNIYIYKVTHKNFIEGDISVKVQGSKRLRFEFGDMEKLQVYADGDIKEINSVAYNQFNIIGNIDTLEILSNKNSTSSGWINENTFYKGRFKNVIIDGNYNHNKNVFFDPCIEGGSVTLNMGICNKFYNVRNEDFKGVYFGKSTYSNFFERAYSSAQNESTYKNVTDEGNLNVVYDTQAYYEQVEIFNIDSYNYNLYDCMGSDMVVTKSDNETFTTAAWTYVVDVCLPLSIERLSIKIDATNKNGELSGCRCSLSVLNSNKETIICESNGFGANGYKVNAETGVLSASVDNANVSFMRYNEFPEGSEYVRIQLRSTKELNISRIVGVAYTLPHNTTLIRSYKPRLNYNKLIPTTE